MQSIDSSNILFTLASDLVNHTGRHIFLTGKAGTGKTTFLKYIRENCPKQMAVVAPTGVAAINAGGVTIHSFFQLPISPFIPEAGGFNNKNEEVVNAHSLLGRLRMNAQKKQILQELELLVIDEISMVRCDTLDAIDTVLRHVRHRQGERFGGVQVLFIGDMFQLPPVARGQEWNLLEAYYNSPYFFDSRVMKEDPPLCIEFNKIYRQTEEKFIRVLNQIRNNELDAEGRQILKDRYLPSFHETEPEGYIVLTTHNEKARSLNGSRLSKLKGELFSYEAEIRNEFAESAYPADAVLQLKTGAQVMFIKNDPEKKFFNGRIGVVTELKKDSITVQCDEDDLIEVKKERWENIRYAVNKASRQLEEEVLGSFIQYPLRLAWAITIHKSQGLTFQKAIIDAGAAFASGQVYVALSRCTSIEGMVLQTEIRTNSLLSDKRIVQFLRNNASPAHLTAELELSKMEYQRKAVLSLFDFTKAGASCTDLVQYLFEHGSSFNKGAFDWVNQLSGHVISLQTTGLKFQTQLKGLFHKNDRADEDPAVQQRISAATGYFSNEIKKLIAFISGSFAVTDSRMHATEYNERLKEVFAELSLKVFLLEGITGNFNLVEFQIRRKNFVLPPFFVNAYAGTSTAKTYSNHPELYQQLKELRDSICSRTGHPIYLVASSKTLEEMTNYLPHTLEELERIKGFGKAKIKLYGSGFLDLILDYCETQGLPSRMEELVAKSQRKEAREPRVNTKDETFRLYKEGKAVADIAKERKLTAQTIEGHLAHYVEKGDIPVADLVSAEKIRLISAAAKDLPEEQSVKKLKEVLGEAVSFGEIRLVLAGLNSPAHKDH
jgi:hypothetical protein